MANDNPTELDQVQVRNIVSTTNFCYSGKTDISQDHRTVTKRVITPESAARYQPGLVIVEPDSLPGVTWSAVIQKSRVSAQGFPPFDEALFQVTMSTGVEPRRWLR